MSLLHCFWDFEAYRAFKEAIRHDSAAIMPYRLIGNADKAKELELKFQETTQYGDASLYKNTSAGSGKTGPGVKDQIRSKKKLAEI